MATVQIPVIFDTDIGDDIDDLYALYLALFHPMLDLAAVTTVHGDTRHKARLASKALRLAGRTDIPIGAGIEMSTHRIRRNQRHPSPADNATYLAYVKESDPEFKHDDFPNAIELMREVLKKATTPVAIIGEGALSNVAQLLKSCSEIEKKKIACLAIMGGETRRVMNEYNILCDPEAADLVLNCGITTFMGTFEITSKLVLPMQDVEKRLGGRKSGPQQALFDCTKMWEPRKGAKPGPVLYDMVPVFWLANPDLVETSPATVRVELEGTYTRGQTVRVADHGPVLESVALDADALVEDALNHIEQAAGHDRLLVP